MVPFVLQPNACPAERVSESVLGHLEEEGGKLGNNSNNRRLLMEQCFV